MRRKGRTTTASVKSKKKPKVLQDMLPDTLGELILVALRDLEQAEASPKYQINMDNWHVPNSHCSVCLGGSVLAFTYKLSPRKKVDGGDGLEKVAGLRTPLSLKLEALDNFRCGYFRLAAELFYSAIHKNCDLNQIWNYVSKVHNLLLDLSIPLYFYDHLKFKVRLYEAGLRLKEAGL